MLKHTSNTGTVCLGYTFPYGKVILYINYHVMAIAFIGIIIYTFSSLMNCCNATDERDEKMLIKNTFPNTCSK